MTTTHSSKLDFMLLVLLALLWGSSYGLIKVGIETIPPATLTAGRITLAAVILTSVLYVRGMSLKSMFTGEPTMAPAMPDTAMGGAQ